MKKFKTLWSASIFAQIQKHLISPQPDRPIVSTSNGLTMTPFKLLQNNLSLCQGITCDLIFTSHHHHHGLQWCYLSDRWYSSSFNWKCGCKDFSHILLFSFFTVCFSNTAKANYKQLVNRKTESLAVVYSFYFNSLLKTTMQTYKQVKILLAKTSQECLYLHIKL